MAKLTKAQQNAVDLLRALIDPSHPGFTGAKEVANALGTEVTKLYIASWILPLLDAIEGAGSKFERRGMNEFIARDAGLARAKAKAAGILPGGTK